MQPLLILIAAKARMFGTDIFDRRPRYLLRNLVMAAVLASLVYATYLFLYRLIFRYVANLEDIGFLLIDRLVTVGFLIFFLLLVLSSCITGLMSLFRSRETEYLFSTPVGIRTMFTGKYLDIVGVSSWAVIVMALPIILAYARVRNFGPAQYALAGVAVIVPFVLTATALGTIATLLIQQISRRLNPLVIVAGAAAGVAGLLYLVLVFSRPTELQVTFQEDFRALNLFVNNFQINTNPYLPNYWVIQGLRAIVGKQYRELALYSGSLISTAIAATAILYTFVMLAYCRIWQQSAERSRAAVFAPRTSMSGMLARPLSGQLRALIAKDIILFVRDPSQWTQLLLIVVLTALYFINISLIPGDIGIEQWRTILFVMNLAFCGFVLATLAIRFVYPSLSLEGASSWVLGSTPVSSLTLFREKFYVSCVLFIVIAETIGITSSVLLQLERIYRVLTFLWILQISITLSCLSVGLGAAYVNFGERNPNKIVSEPGGILTTLIILGYLTGMIATAGIPAYRYTTYLVSGGTYPGGLMARALALGVAGTVIGSVLPLWYGARSFINREF